MATNDDANRLGLATPEGTDFISEGDDAIAGNARAIAALFDEFRMNRGKISPGSNLDTFTTPKHSGLWHVDSSSASETITGTPPDVEPGVQYELFVMMGATGTHWLFPYGYYGLPFAYVRTVTDATGGKSMSEWKAWEPTTSADIGDGTEGAWAAHLAMQARFIAAMGGPIDTGGKAAVALRCDHGLAPFRDKVLPLTRAAGFKVSQAYNPRNWHYPENQGVTASDLNGWVADGDVEIWNHSASHAPADTEDALYEQIVNGLAEIEAELPAAAGQVWGWNPPGVSSGDYGGYDGGKRPEGWNTYAGRLILAHHAVASGSLIGTQLHPLDGSMRPGRARYQMDSLSVAKIKARIDEAIEARAGLQLMLHPSQLDKTGKITTAQLTEVIDYIVAKRDAGELVTLSPYELTIADSTRRPPTDLSDIEARLALLEEHTPQDLGTAHLDTVVTPGPHYQPFASRATKAQGYPWDGVAGILDVQVWNPANGNLIATFKSWNRGTAKRTYYLGEWLEWLDAFGEPID